MLGEVPICVISPPSSAANDIGIRKRDGDTPERRAIWKAIGSMIASAPIFLTKAESTATTVTRINSCTRGAETLGAMRASAMSMMPDRDTAALTTSALPTIMTISSESPENAFSAGTTPTTTAASSASAATRS